VYLERLARRYAIPHTYTDYQSMLAEEPLDLVVVAAPNDLHHDMTLAALTAGAHVVCEKPLALNTEQALEMTTRAVTARRVHFVPFIWRFVPAMIYAKEIIDSGFIGQPYHVDVRYFVQGWGDPAGPMRWQYSRVQAGSGSLANLGSHLIHVVQWWLCPIRRVSALATTTVKERLGPDGSMVPVDVDDSCRFLAALEDDTPVTFSLSSIAYVRRVNVEIALCGSEGSMIFQEDWGAPDASIGRIWATRAGDPGPSAVPIPERLTGEFLDGPDYYTPFRSCFSRMAREVVGAIQEGRDAAPSFHDGLRVQEVLDAVVRSAHEERWMTVHRAEVAATKEEAVTTARPGTHEALHQSKR
jgi:predicted dehydrogenase